MLPNHSSIDAFNILHLFVLMAEARLRFKFLQALMLKRDGDGCLVVVHGVRRHLCNGYILDIVDRVVHDPASNILEFQGLRLTSVVLSVAVSILVHVEGHVFFTGGLTLASAARSMCASTSLAL